MTYLVLALATLRLTLLIGREAGPFDIFTRFRVAMGMSFDVYGNEKPTNAISKMLNCFWCLSMWIAGGLSILHLLSPKATHTLSAPLALSAAAIVLESQMYGNSHDED